MCVTHGRLDVLQELHGAALALQQRLGAVHDLPHNLLQVRLLLKQVVHHLKQSLRATEESHRVMQVKRALRRLLPSSKHHFL